MVSLIFEYCNNETFTLDNKYLASRNSRRSNFNLSYFGPFEKHTAGRPPPAMPVVAVEILAKSSDSVVSFIFIVPLKARSRAGAVSKETYS